MDYCYYVNYVYFPQLGRMTSVFAKCCYCCALRENRSSCSCQLTDKRTALCVNNKFLLKYLIRNIFRLMLTVVASILKYIYFHIILYSREECGLCFYNKVKVCCKCINYGFFSPSCHGRWMCLL